MGFVENISKTFNTTWKKIDKKMINAVLQSYILKHSTIRGVQVMAQVSAIIHSKNTGVLEAYK